MEDCAHGRDGQVRLEVGLVVPQEGADPVRVADPQTGEGLGQAFRPIGHLGEGPIHGVAFGADDGADQALAVDLLAVAEDPTDQQWAVLHGAEHDASSPTARTADARVYRVMPSIGLEPATVDADPEVTAYLEGLPEPDRATCRRDANRRVSHPSTSIRS